MLRCALPAALCIPFHHAELGEAPRRPSSIFPGTDGSLYAYMATDAGRPRIEVSKWGGQLPSAGLASP